MRKWAVVIAIVALIVGAIVFWYLRPGTFSYCNYERIKPGMSLGEVETLLGAKGTEISSDKVPGTPTRRVVSGDQYFRWSQGNVAIIISLRNGVVAEKDYWEISL